MRKKVFDPHEAGGGRAERGGSAQAAMRPGRTLRMALAAAGGTIVLSLVISGAVSSRIPSFGGSGAGGPAKSSTLFYHASYEQTLHGSGDGQVYLDAKLNERTFHLRINPALSKTLLSTDDARSAGLVKGPLDYSGRLMTPMGEVRTATVTIPYLQFGTLTLFNVEAQVTDASLPESVLGMDFLKRFQSFEVRQGDLVLRW